VSETVKLYKEVDWDGVTVNEVVLDLDNLTGAHMIAAERQFNLYGGNEGHPLKELSKEYQILVAAQAAKKPVELLHKLSAKDFSRVTIKVQNFLLEGDSEEEEQTE
jgi:hypothetical protein